MLVGADSGPLYWGLDSLRGRRLALATTHPLRAELQRLHPGIQLVDAASGAAALALVQQGRADAAMDIKPVVQQQLGSSDGQGLRVLGDVAEFTARYRVALPATHGRLLPVLDAALADIDNEEKQRSVRRWLVTEPVVQRPWWRQGAWTGLLAAAALMLAGGAAWGGWRWWALRAEQRGRLGAVQRANEGDREGPVAIPGARARLTADAQAGRADAAPERTAVVVASTSRHNGSTDLQLATLLGAVVEPLRQQAEAAGQRLVWAVDDVLPARIRSDPVLLAELLQLLLQRALAQVLPQGTQGRVVFKARRGSLDNGHPALQLVVSTSASADVGEAEQDARVQRAQDLAWALGGDLQVRGRAGGGHVVIVRVPLRGASRVQRT